MSTTRRSEASEGVHKAARPMKFVRDAQGNGWLCDQDVDQDGDLESQGCWRCGDMAFPTGGR